MRITFLAESWRDLPATDLADAFVGGWSDVAPTDELNTRGVDRHGPGLLAAVAGARGGSCRDVGGVPVLVTDDAALAVFDAKTAAVTTPGSSAGVATAWRAIARDGVAAKVIVGVGPGACDDAGQGLVADLVAGEAPWWRDVPAVAFAAHPEPFFTPGVTTVKNLASPHAAAHAAVQSQRLAVATSLAGPVGETHVQRLLGAPHAGAGGGLALGLSALGAEVTTSCEPLLDVVGAATHRDADGATTDLIVVAVEVFDWRSLRDSMVTAAADAGAAAGVPVIVCAGAVDVGRREQSSVGVSGAYACVPDAVLTPSGSLAQPVGADAVAERGRALAATWSREAVHGPARHTLTG